MTKIMPANVMRLASQILEEVKVSLMIMWGGVEGQKLHLREDVLSLNKINANLGVVYILFREMVRKSRHHVLWGKLNQIWYVPIAP